MSLKSEHMTGTAALTLKVIKGRYSILKFPITSGIPQWMQESPFFSFTRTPDEISVVTAEQGSIPEEVPVSSGWNMLKITGPLDFSMTGIIAGISRILSERNIPIFVISTFETDYILVQSQQLEPAIRALSENGYKFLSGD